MLPYSSAKPKTRDQKFFKGDLVALINDPTLKDPNHPQNVDPRLPQHIGIVTATYWDDETDEDDESEQYNDEDHEDEYDDNEDSDDYDESYPNEPVNNESTTPKPLRPNTTTPSRPSRSLSTPKEKHEDNNNKDSDNKDNVVHTDYLGTVWNPDDDDQTIPEGYMVVEWDDYLEDPRLISEDDCICVDRSVSVSDIVRYANPEQQHIPQSGTIIDMRMTVDLQHETNPSLILRNVDAKRLQLLDPMQDQYIAYNGWVGRHLSTKNKVCIQSDDGLEDSFEIDEEDIEDGDGWENFLPCYPGQKLNLSTQWVNSPVNGKEVTVTKVEPVGVTVEYWAYYNPLKETQEEPLEPDTYVEVGKFKVMSSRFLHAFFQIRDGVVFLNPQDIKEYIKDGTIIDESKFHVFNVIRTRTFVDIQWQDATIERNVPASEVV
ncbi:hypothetical protein HK102_006030, partial [Quaeritorhiza haematococci]